MNLVIVESPAKAKTIENYLNSINDLNHLGKFKVLASLGHIQDLPEKKIGIDTNTWTIEYEPLKTKTAVIKSLKTEAKNAKMVYLASDMDLEGNAIAYHLKTILQLKKSKYVRVIFNEITKVALKQAFLNPTDIDMNMFAAQETRRILDRLVGYELSPLLWRRFVTQSLSAGRVQSAGLKMIVSRYENILQHNPEQYLICEGLFNFNNKESIKQDLITNIYSKETKSIMHWKPELNISFDKILYNIIKIKEPWIATFKTKKTIKNPSAPFTTSKFQQEVYDLYRIPSKVAMRTAQKLYEGGYITYMRTDSVQLSQDAQMKIVEFINNIYGTEMLEPRVFITKQDNAQEAHEAIRPTDMNISILPDTFNPDTNDQKIYSLIRRRTIASQMIGAEYLDITYTIPIGQITAEDKTSYYFYGKESLLIKKGYLEIYSPDIKINSKLRSVWEEIIKEEKISVKLENLKGVPHLTKVTQLFNESTIIKSFEKEGIGRPSTYAKILDILYTRHYIEKGKCPEKEVQCIEYEWNRKSNIETIIQKPILLTTGNKETDYILPTSLGTRVIEYLEPIVPFLLDVTFTSHMETDLDKIMKGKSEKNKVLNEFYIIFHKAVDDAKEIMKTKSTKDNDTKNEKNKLYPKKDSIIHSYNENLLVVKTKYGPSLLDITNSKWYSIKPFIDWKKITFKDISVNDLKFIMSLPKSIENTSRVLCLGPYGLYIKESNAKINYILPEEYWEKAYNGTLESSYVNSLQPHYSKKPDHLKENLQKKKYPKSKK